MDFASDKSPESSFKMSHYYSPQGLPLFPATWRDQQKLISIPENHLVAFLRRDLFTDRLTYIKQYLWLAGRLYPPRPLHTQLLMSREILITDQVELHLIWAKGRIFVKPLPRYLLDDHFRETQFPESEVENSDRAKLSRCARGFLHSYTALVANESDFKIAMEKGLLPGDLDWMTWHAFVRRLVSRPSTSPNIYSIIDERYHYGELRLGRLDKIYRYSFRDVLYGYSHETATSLYSDFFADNFGYVVAVLGYFVIVLTAMQVGLSDTYLETNNAFNMACYVFTVFSLLAPLAAAGLIFFMFMTLLLGHWRRTSKDRPRRLSAMGIKHQDNTYSNYYNP